MPGICKSALSVSLVIAISYGSIAIAQPEPRIVEGSDVTDDRYPFMVAVYSEANREIDFYPSCGGTVIGSRWVMTAAHCVVNIVTGEQVSASEVPVVVGARDLTDESAGTLLVARNIYVHPDFNIQNVDADIALIELPEDVGTPILALPLAGSDVPTVDESATALGWGFIDEVFNESPILQEVDIPIVAHASCLPFYAGTDVSPQLDANVCAGGGISGRRNVCNGDSGGPLFVERDGLLVQVGIASYSKSCARPNITSVHTRVSHYTDWVAGFVSDLQTTNGGSGMLDNADILAGSPIVVLSADTPTSSDSLLQGELAVYEVTGATRVDLNSMSGDADLLITTGTRVEAEDVACVSFVATPLDTCNVPDTSQRVFASVSIYSDSTYEITVVGESEAGVGTDDSLVIDPPDVQEPPAEDPPVAEEPPADGESAIAEAPAMEQPAIVDSQVIDEPPNDDSQLSISGGSSGDGGFFGGLSLLTLSVLAFGRRRYSRH